MKSKAPSAGHLSGILGTFALACFSADATTVWNVNIGGSAVSGSGEITTEDNYLGAAPENTENSTWNAISSAVTTALADSTGSTAAGVTLTFTAAAGSAVDFGGKTLDAGDEIFDTWIKDGGANGPNNDPYTITFAGLDDGAEYALVIYSDWWWGTNAVPVTQSVGTGLSGTFFINSPRIDSSLTVGGLGGVGPLLEDTNPANATANATTGLSNYARFNGLAASGGELSFTVSAVDGPVNGFQLIELGTDAAPQLIITPNASTTGNYDFTWNSTTGMTYDLVSSTDLSTPPDTWPVWDGRSDILATPPENTLLDIPGGADARRFFAVVEK